ncbi:hypothetical protein UMM65_00205 [Aureibaculum sp. 2210JD6-5]|uniref:hypothetical protein n=1 Tax=Aureibaculum sp. 2210JD6-5 TaxID=3103957 RepID=UPI002AAE92DF|nr:hypothetical protein [Aureibaculum sp. 2210JD6-5]MDY7393650.1 hypothetical protein [Aureibaculum sp. 2210JD6-5]
MKTLILSLFIFTLLLNCSNADNLNSDDKEIWKGVFYDNTAKANVHDPQYNYTLMINSLNKVDVILPYEDVEEKVISIEILNDSEMDISWKLKNETKIVRSMYHYNNQNELIIDKFIYTAATIPFPSNLVTATFIKEREPNNL